MRIEGEGFVPAEAMEFSGAEIGVAQGIQHLQETLSAAMEKVKNIEINREKIEQQAENLTWALLPLASKAIGTGTKYYMEFADLARKTNYSAMDNKGRAVIGFTDTSLTVLLRVAKDTLGYIKDTYNF